MPRRRYQRGHVFFRGGRWCASYREYEPNPATGKRTRRTITFPESVVSERAAHAALQPFLDEYNKKAVAEYRPPAKPRQRRRAKTLVALVDEWTDKILHLRKPSGARAAKSHINGYIRPMLGEVKLHDMNLSRMQTFLSTVGQKIDRKKTAENIYATLSSILNLGRKWGYSIPTVSKGDLVFPTDKRPKHMFYFDPNTAAKVINATPHPYKVMLLVAAINGLRIGEVTALKVSSLDFQRRLIHINGALDYSTRKEGTPKSKRSTTSVCMSELIAKHLRDWLAKHYRPNPQEYLFTNSKGRPHCPDNVVKYGVHRAVEKLGLEIPKGVPVGIHAFRHGATTGLLEAGTPIHVVQKMMRHSDSKTTLTHYAHVVDSVHRAAAEKFSQQIGAQLESEIELEPNAGLKSA